MRTAGPDQADRPPLQERPTSTAHADLEHVRRTPCSAQRRCRTGDESAFEECPAGTAGRLRLRSVCHSHTADRQDSGNRASAAFKNRSRDRATCLCPVIVTCLATRILRLTKRNRLSPARTLRLFQSFLQFLDLFLQLFKLRREHPATAAFTPCSAVKQQHRSMPEKCADLTSESRFPV